VLGTHDGFPSYELYINGTRVYQHDPIPAGEGPGALFPPSDRRVSIPWTRLAGIETNRWTNPTSNGFPIDASPWEWSGKNQTEKAANKDAADLFCEWKNHDHASSWTIGKDEAIASRGTQRFSTNNPGQPRYCDFCRWHIKQISCARRTKVPV
jgi:hypothetical protein